MQSGRILGTRSLEVADEDEKRCSADAEGERREERHPEDEAWRTLPETGGAPCSSLPRDPHSALLPLL